MAAPLHIVFLMQDLCFGGTQRQTLELAKRLDRARFSPSIWTCTGATDLDEFAEQSLIPVTHLGVGRAASPLFIPRLFSKLMLERPDILVLCTALPNVWGRIMGRLSFTPLIVGTCRGGGALSTQHEPWLWKLTHHMICNSMQLYDSLANLGIPSGRITYIPNGVDTDYFCPGTTPFEKRNLRILSVGRMVSDKNQFTLLRAFLRVLEKFPHASLYIVGEGPQEHTLRRIVEGAAYHGQAHILPPSTDIRQHYAGARVFALSSIREGQPNVILEAMASALPVVSTNVGGIPNMVSNNVSGILCPPNDSVTLANNICRLLEDPELAYAMGKEGRKIAETNFSFVRMVYSHQELFERLWSMYHGK